MTDKEKIREEVVELVNSINPFIPDEDGKNSDYEAGKLDAATQILQIIDSLQEPVSKDLEKENKIEILADIIFNAAKHGYMPYDTQDEYCAMEIARKNIDKFIVPKKQE